MCGAMRHYWLLLGACGWVVLVLMSVSRFFSSGAVNGFPLVLQLPPTVQKHAYLGIRPIGHSKLPIGENVRVDGCLFLCGPVTDWQPIYEKAGAQSWMVPRLMEEKTRPVSSHENLSLSQLSEAPPVSDWQSVVDERIKLLSTVCKNNSLRNLTHVSISKFVLNRIFVCDKHKILFCQTPKVGNTQWKKVLIVLNGAFPTVDEVPENLVHDPEKNGLPRLSSLTPQEITLRLNTYFKFLIVRDPFERLISAFKDKFVKNPRFEPWYKHDIAPVIIRKYRKSHRSTGLAASGLHFEDFVRYLGDPEGHRRVDRQFGEHIIHWVTYAELCAPCEIHYNVVGHHETLEQDASHILKAAGIDRLVSYPAIPPGITHYNRTKVEHYFAAISKRDIRRLYARYQGDFHLFGYPSPDFLLN